MFSKEIENTDGTPIHLHWQPTMKEAIEKATTENKPILIYFTGSDWCKPCIDLGKNLFLYTAGFPRNKDLVTSENRKIKQSLKFRDVTGMVIKIVSTLFYLKAIQNFGKQKYQGISKEILIIITKYSDLAGN